MSEVPRTMNISLASRDPQWVHERLVFERFVAAAGIRIKPDSITRGVGFDVACDTVDGDQLRFELTEAVDREWASNVGAMTETDFPGREPVPGAAWFE